MRSLSNTIASVTLLTAGFSVLFFEHGPQPEAMASMSLCVAGGGAAITPVAARAAKLFGIMNLKNFAVRMADEGPCEGVGLFARPIRSEVGGFYLERLSDSGVTHLASVNNVVSADANLMAENRIVVVRGLVL